MFVNSDNMQKTILLLFPIILFLNGCKGQDVKDQQPGLTYYINSNVKNADEPYFNEIEQLWKAYLNKVEYFRNPSEYWSNEEMVLPEVSYATLLTGLRKKINEGEESIQCSILGIIPVKNDHYVLNTMFSQMNDSLGVVDIKFIISVYVKKMAGEFKFISSTEYHKQLYENRKIGNINYIIHPDHKFSEADAIKMNAFNNEFARRFGTTPISFDYVVANNTTDLSNLKGTNFNDYSFQPVQSGGLADNYNKIIYAGNNSAYYPHEVIHLYTYDKFQRQYHRWVDEGVAALFGGSTGYNIKWHWEKLRRFLEEQPDYEIKDLKKLETDIPNGEYTTDFRYAIGGFICQKIYEKEGMNGLFEALEAGRSDEDYFALLEEKLGFKQAEFGQYIKKEVAKLKPIKDEDLDQFKY